jgi:hypothetical protein
MRRWTLILALAGFLGAAIFYWPYFGLSPEVQWICPVCSRISMSTGVWERFIPLRAGGGVVNATLFVIVGLSIRAALRLVFDSGGSKGSKEIRKRARRAQRTERINSGFLAALGMTISWNASARG